MKKILILLLPIMVYAESFSELLQIANKNLLLQSKQQELNAKKALYGAAKSKNYPTLSASLQAIYLKDHPAMFLHLPSPGLPPEFQVGTQQNYIGQITLRYPIFSGFAISSLIEKSKLDIQKSRLELQDARRNLYLQISTLYGALYSIDAAIKANTEAMKAVTSSYKKAKGFFEAGLLAPSELENIKAKKFETKAMLQKLRIERKSMLSRLSYLTNRPIKEIAALPEIRIESERALIQTALSHREDLKALEKVLQMDEEDLRLAESTRYPTLAIEGALKTQGENLKLNGDGYTNPNKSYIALAAEWKLFDGFESAHRIEAAKAKRLGRILLLKDYKNRIETELQTALENLESLQSEKEAKTAQLSAQQSYYKLTRGRFENHLAGADELSRAIAAKAEAQARLKEIEARIFQQKCKILLESSLKSFEQSITPEPGL